MNSAEEYIGTKVKNILYILNNVEINVLLEDIKLNGDTLTLSFFAISMLFARRLTKYLISEFGGELIEFKQTEKEPFPTLNLEYYLIKIKSPIFEMLKF